MPKKKLKRISALCFSQLQQDLARLEALTKIHKLKRVTMRISRWSCRLMKYNFEVQYKCGNQNKVADGLSRLPLNANVNEYDTEDEVICQVALEQMCKCITVEKLKHSAGQNVQQVQQSWPFQRHLPLNDKTTTTQRDWKTSSSSNGRRR